MANEQMMFTFLEGLRDSGAPQNERIRLLADRYDLPILRARLVVKRFDSKQAEETRNGGKQNGK